jgi:hypothetical protein
VNAYVWSDDARVATVASTGRVRVASTFSYISGFSNFVALAVPILLATAASADRAWLSYTAAGLLAATTPMTGARAAVLFVAVGSLAVLGVSGSLSTRRGKVALIALVVAAVGGMWAAPEAAQGVQDRFDSDETYTRFRDLAMMIPFYLILQTPDSPPLGAGVGVLQNASAALGIQSGWEVEAEPQRVLIELGLPGYALVWLSRLVLGVALIRAARRLSRAGAGAVAGVAWAYAGFVMVLPLATDHIAQALFFAGVGWVLARYVQTVDLDNTARQGP